MTLKNEKFGKSMFKKLTDEIYFTFLIWKFYEIFGKVITSNKTLMESRQIDLIIPYYLWNSCGRDIFVRLNSLLTDSDPRSLSLLRILYEIEEEDCQIENFRAILKGDFHLLSQRLKENVKKFKCKLGEKEEIFLKNQNLFEKLQNHLKELLELAGLFSSKSLLKNIENVKKIKEDLPEVKKLFEVKENLEETLKNIESKIGSIKEKEILTTIRKLNLEKDWENFKIESPEMNNIEAFWDTQQVLAQYQQEITSLNNNIKCLDFLKEEFKEEIEGIGKNIEQLYQSLIFKILREVRNEYIAHFPKKELPKITISFEETKEVVEKTIKEITKIIGINISPDLTPVYQGNYYTAFMVPWLQPACNESQEIETISGINKYKNGDHFACDLTLTNGLSFYIDDFPSEYKWEKGDEVAIFWSYNYQSPKECFVISNFSKKQWVKGMLSWLSNRNGSWILPEI